MEIASLHEHITWNGCGAEAEAVIKLEESSNIKLKNVLSSIQEDQALYYQKCQDI